MRLPHAKYLKKHNMEIKKSKKASLEDKFFSTYLLMGLVFVLSICYVALEWTEHEIEVFEQTTDEEFFVEEIEIQQTQQQEVTPPPPAPEQQVVEVLNVVDDNVEVAHVEIQDQDDDSEVEIKAPVAGPVIEEEEEKEDEVFLVVENMPEFPGGQPALFKYLAENIKYPVIAQENGVQGKVICQFTVNKDGSIVDVIVLKSSGDQSLDNEAIRVLTKSPKWTPGKQRGKPVRVKYTVPVVFKLQ